MRASFRNLVSLSRAAQEAEPNPHQFHEFFTRAQRIAAGARVVTPGSGPLVGLLRRDHSDLALSLVDSYAEALAAVAAGTADVAALNFHVGGHLARRDYAETIIVPAAPFERQPTAFCVLKGHNADLLSVFDSALAEAKREGLGERLERQWLGGPAGGSGND